MKIKLIDNGNLIYDEPININRVEHSLYSTNTESVVVLRREKDTIIIEKTKLDKENIPEMPNMLK